MIPVHYRRTIVKTVVVWLLCSALVTAIAALPIVDSAGDWAGFVFLLVLFVPPPAACFLLHSVRPRWRFVHGFSTLGSIGLVAGFVMAASIHYFDPSTKAYLGEWLYLLFGLLGNVLGLICVAAVALFRRLGVRRVCGAPPSVEPAANLRADVFQMIAGFTGLSVVLPLVVVLMIRQYLAPTSPSFGPVVYLLVPGLVACLTSIPSELPRVVFTYGLVQSSFLFVAWKSAPDFLADVPNKDWATLDWILPLHILSAPVIVVLSAVLTWGLARVPAHPDGGAGAASRRGRSGALVLAAIPTGLFALVCCDSLGINILRSQTPDSIFYAYPSGVEVICISRDGSIIASLDDESVLRVHRQDPESDSWTLVTERRDATALAISATADQIAVGGQDGSIKLIDATSGRVLSSTNASPGPVQCIAFLSSPGRLISGHTDPDSKLSSLQIWEHAGDSLTVQMQTNLGFEPRHLSVGRNGRFVACAGHHDTIVFQTSTLHEFARREGIGRELISATPDGLYAPRMVIAIENRESTATVIDWYFVNRETEREFNFESDSVRALQHLDSDRLAVASHGPSEITVWNLSSGRRTRLLRGLRYPVSAVGASPDGTYVVAGSTAGVNAVWRLRDK
ncbi:MAG: hypothetical protein DWQ34_07190 [Planctomycetota bacterium]|nr:MAG: hypothetical protein DWQ34_07190 [Planctomycetota bacterium]REK23444.1 MAG: hypothetical protein DWQ41_16980 [Planctomycetota bacterium]REK38916.1 MAG: hypothetical protein DWQ45_03475 [Planctomycetota bacterium]